MYILYINPSPYYRCSRGPPPVLDRPNHAWLTPLIYMYIYIYVYVCIYTYICIYIYMLILLLPYRCLHGPPPVLDRPSHAWLFKFI